MISSHKNQQLVEREKIRQSARDRSGNDLVLILFSELVFVLLLLRSDSFFDSMKNNFEHSLKSPPFGSISPELVLTAELIYATLVISLLAVIPAGGFLLRKATEKGLDPISALPKMKFGIATSYLTLAVLPLLVSYIGLFPLVSIFGVTASHKIRNLSAYQKFVFELEDRIKVHSISFEKI